MAPTPVESFLEEKIGLSAEAIGSDVIARAVRLRMADLGLPDVSAYHGCLTASEEEQTALIETVVVPETWFFRNKKAFRFMVDYVTGSWLRQNPGRRLRALSVPCSTGEEAYSIAMSLMDAGIPNDRLHIDGVDISETALARARTGLYARASFRGDDLSFRNRYFDPEGDAFRLHEDVRQSVRFVKGNVLDLRIGAHEMPYDIIFCRNLLIYLSPQAKERTLQVIHRLLSDSGILFLGHAERQAAVVWGLAGIPEFGVFACRKDRRKPSQKVLRTAEPRPSGKRFEKPARDHSPPCPALVSNGLDRAPGPVLSPPVPDAGVQGAVERDLFSEAQCLADRGSLSMALELCQSLLKDHPVHVQAHFLMGLIYEALDRVDKSEESFNKAIYLDPNHSEALTHLSYIVEKRGDRSQAAHLRERAQRVFRKQADI